MVVAVDEAALAAVRVSKAPARRWWSESWRNGLLRAQSGRAAAAARAVTRHPELAVLREDQVGPAVAGHVGKALPGRVADAAGRRAPGVITRCSRSAGCRPGGSGIVWVFRYRSLPPAIAEPYAYEATSMDGVLSACPAAPTSAPNVDAAGACRHRAGKRARSVAAARRGPAARTAGDLDGLQRAEAAKHAVAEHRKRER